MYSSVWDQEVHYGINLILYIPIEVQYGINFILYLEVLLFHRLPCVCHMLATVTRHTPQLSDLSKTILQMKEDDIQMEQLNKIRETVSAIKNGIAFLKRSGSSEKY